MNRKIEKKNTNAAHCHSVKVDITLLLSWSTKLYVQHVKKDLFWHLFVAFQEFHWKKKHWDHNATRSYLTEDKTFKRKLAAVWHTPSEQNKERQTLLKVLPCIT